MTFHKSQDIRTVHYSFANFITTKVCYKFLGILSFKHLL